MVILVDIKFSGNRLQTFQWPENLKFLPCSHIVGCNPCSKHQSYVWHMSNHNWKCVVVHYEPLFHQLGKLSCLGKCMLTNRKQLFQLCIRDKVKGHCRWWSYWFGRIQDWLACFHINHRPWRPNESHEWDGAFQRPKTIHFSIFGSFLAHFGKLEIIQGPEGVMRHCTWKTCGIKCVVYFCKNGGERSSNLVRYNFRNYKTRLFRVIAFTLIANRFHLFDHFSHISTVWSSLCDIPIKIYNMGPPLKFW